MGMTGAEKMRARRERADAAGLCHVCCKALRTNGNACKDCYNYNLERKKIWRKNKREAKTAKG